MRLLLGAVGAAAVAVLATGCQANSITADRLENAIGPTFSRLYVQQQELLGTTDDSTPAQASATCSRRDAHTSTTGSGDDWICQLQLQMGGPTQAVTYEVTVKGDGCYTADGPPAVVGNRVVKAKDGRERVNPLFAFDGCFDIT